MKRIIFIGIAGSGKGARIQECMKKGFVQLSTGNLLRNAGYDLSSGELVNDSIVIDLVKDFLEKNHERDVIFDGFPRNINQAKLLLKSINIDKVIYIKFNPETAIKRALARTICPSCQTTYIKDIKPPKRDGICDFCSIRLVRRDDDNIETMQKRIKVFYEETLPIVDFFKQNGICVIEINGEISAPNQILDIV